MTCDQNLFCYCCQSKHIELEGKDFSISSLTYLLKLAEIATGVTPRGVHSNSWTGYGAWLTHLRDGTVFGQTRVAAFHLPCRMGRICLIRLSQLWRASLLAERPHRFLIDAKERVLCKLILQTEIQIVQDKFRTCRRHAVRNCSVVQIRQLQGRLTSCWALLHRPIWAC